MSDYNYAALSYSDFRLLYVALSMDSKVCKRPVLPTGVMYGQSNDCLVLSLNAHDQWPKMTGS